MGNTKIGSPASIEIIENCKRLLRDAHLVLEQGSAGSALSLAILAFEEAGKGHHYELSMEKTKRTPSWHVYRQSLAAQVFFVSLYQKYGLAMPNLSERAKELMEERSRSAKTLDELDSIPIPEELRAEVISSVTAELKKLSKDDFIIATTEMRWVKKIMKSAFSGRIEAIRQKGMYVDLVGDAVQSTPNKVDAVEAYYWIRVAERALLLVERGDYTAPYGELAAILEAMPKPLPTMEELVKILPKFEEIAAEIGSNGS